MDTGQANKSPLLRQLGFLGASVLMFWGLSYGLLSFGDAFECELGGHPDEASHYVSGLMVYDYVWEHLGEHPLAFATRYYDFYPKVAIGHFPPGYYLMEAIWFSFASVSLASVLSFQSFVCGILAGCLACALVGGGAGRLVGIGVGAFFCSLPLVQRYVGMVMSDLLLGLFCFLSCLSFALFLQRPSKWLSFLFGCLAAMTIMIKGSGLMLAFVPPISLILTRRYELFRSQPFWLAVVPVLVVCLPWMLFTYKITEEGMVQEWSLGYVADALPYFAKQTYRTFGIGLGILMLFGLRASLKGRVASGKVPELSAVMLALPIGLILTYILIPVGFEQRYLLPAIAPAMYFAGIGFVHLHGLLKARLEQNWKASFVLLLLIASYGIEVFEIPQKRFRGFQAFVDAMHLEGENEGKRILISSDSRGEGAVVASVAMQDVRPRHQVLRSSKVLSTSDWMGRGYQLAHTNATDLIQFLQDEEIDWLIVDTSMQAQRIMDHHSQMASLVDTYPSNFHLVKEGEIERRFWGESRRAALYELVGNDADNRNDESEQH